MNLRSSLAASALVAALICSAPAVRAQQDDLSAVDPTVAGAPAPPIITAEAVLKAMQAQDPRVVLVDTQPAEGYADGHIPGAINYPWTMQIKTFPISLPRNKTLIFYGSCPHDTDDTIRQLAEFGYFNVKVMEGGWYKWVSLNYPAVGKGDYAMGQMTGEQSSNRPSAVPQATVAQVASPAKTGKPASH